MFLCVSDSTAQSVLCQPIVQADGTIVGTKMVLFLILRHFYAKHKIKTPGRVVPKVYNVIHRINLYPVDNATRCLRSKEIGNK